ncbi:MAG: hypothetical protein LBH25_04150 [Fibromonadaceae bacterium]|jgi:type IV pilus secretin PilQ/predicted competence protein|nr:hypothetical protein [Fibromonadaceae bacterium]
MKKNIIAVIQLLVFSMAVSSFAAVGSNKKYDISFVNANFQAVFHSISKLANVDILLAPDVQGTLSMNVTKKTWQEMLNIVCKMHDLTWKLEGNYISIQKTTSYQGNLERDLLRMEKNDDLVPLMRRNFQVMHAPAAEMAEVLKTIKSKRGSISTVERNNAIIVYDTERRLAQMQKTLAELDVETMQVVITAKLVVVDSRLVNELGVDWTRLNVGNADSRVQASFQSMPSVAFAPSGYPTSLTIGAFNQNMQAAVDNLLSDSRSEILASPQISTLDHTKATIFMGDEISVRVMDESGQTAYKMVESGIKLTVTPHVAGDNRILLELSPENNSYGYDDKSQVVISKQQANTKVVVADGETVVIGGLTKNDEVETEAGIPFLKDIPVLGYLFKHSRKEITKKDLIIFVTPRIMHNYLGNSVRSRSTAPVASQASEARPAAPAQEEEYEEEEYEDGWE